MTANEAIGSTSLSLGISPRGHLHVAPGEPEAAPLPPNIGSRVAEAFQRGSGEGLLHLGAVEVATLLPPVLAYWRDFGHLFMERLCAVPDLDPKGPLEVAPPLNLLESRAAAAPPDVWGRVPDL